MKFTNLTKSFSAILLLAGIAVAVYSCSKNEEVLNLKEIALNSFEQSLKDKKTALFDFVKANTVYSSRSMSFDKNAIEERRKKQEQQAKLLLQPLLRDSKEFLLQYGITNDLLKEEFGDENHPAIIELSILFLRAEKLKSKNKQVITASFDFISPIFYSFSGNSEVDLDWYDCLIRAFGIDAVIEIVNSNVVNSTMAKSLLKNSIRKIASRTLGWIGAGIAVYEYGDCMDWY